MGHTHTHKRKTTPCGFCLLFRRVFQEKASLQGKNLKPLKQWTLVLVAQATQVVKLKIGGFFQGYQTSLATRALVIFKWYMYILEVQPASIF